MRKRETLAQGASRIGQLQVEADAGSLAAQREADERRAALHSETLDAIQAVLDGRHYTPETPETIASLLRAIGLPVRGVPSRQHYGLVLVVDAAPHEDAEDVWSAVADLVGADESILYVGPALPLGYGEDPSYSTRQLSLATGDRRGTISVSLGDEL